MKHRFLPLLALALVACADIPTPMPDKDGGSKSARIFGGKGTMTYNADGSMAFTWSLEKTAQHFFQALSLAITQGLSALVDLEKQTTEQLLQGQITKRQFNEQMALIQQAKINAGVRGAEVVNPNIALPLRQ